MKNIFTLLLFVSFTVQVTAQSLPNNKFEKWDSEFLYEEPQSWHTPNPFTSIAFAVCVEKSEDAYSGSFSARLETIDVLNGSFQVPGLLTLADFDVDINSQQYSFSGGYFLQENVSKLSGMYKYAGAEGDSASIIMYNFAHPEGEDMDTIGYGFAFLHDAEDWTPFEVNMLLNNTHIPDTFNVMILSSGSNNLNVGSVLYVDSLTIETNTGIIDLWKPQTPLHVYPNPAVETVNFEVSKSGSSRTLFIHDVNGKLVMEIPFNGLSIQLDIQHLEPGVFTYSLIENRKRTHSGSFLKK